MPDSDDQKAQEGGTAPIEGGASTSGEGPEMKSSEEMTAQTWEERESDTLSRLAPHLEQASTGFTPDSDVEGAEFTRLSEAADRFSKMSSRPTSEDDAQQLRLSTLSGTAGKMDGSEPTTSTSSSTNPGSGSGDPGYTIGRTGDEMVDASLAAREAEMNEAAEFVGIQGPLLTNGSGEHYTFDETGNTIDLAGKSIMQVASDIQKVYASGEQQWFQDLVGSRQPTLDLMAELGNGSGDGIGQITTGLSKATESVNTAVDRMNISAANYSQQYVQAVDDKSVRDSFWQMAMRHARADRTANSAPVAEVHPKPIVPDYGYIPAIDNAATVSEGVVTQLSSFATNDLVGKMRELAGPLDSGAQAGNKLGENTGAATAQTQAPGGPRGGGGGSRRGGTPVRGGGSSRGGSGSSRKKGASDEKIKAVADKLAGLFSEAGGGKAGADAVAAAAGAQGLTSAQLAAAGLSPDMLSSMASNPMFNPSGAGGPMQGGMPMGSYPGGGPLDQRLAGLGGTHLSNSGDLSGVRGALGADVGGGLMGGGSSGAAGRPFSAEARSMDSMLASPPPPGVGDPVRRTALGADMRPLDPNGTGRMSPDATPATRQNTLDSNGNPREVDTTITVDGEEHPITIGDPRLMEMMNIVSEEGSAESPMPILESAKRAGIELSSYGEYIANPMDAKPGDVVISGKGNGFYMGDGRVLMESGEIKPISEVLELRPPNNGIFRLDLPDLPDENDSGHKNWDEQKGESEGKGASSGGSAPATPSAAPAGDSSFDPFSQSGGTAPPTTDAPMDSPIGPDTTTPAPTETGTADPTGGGTTPVSPTESPRVASELPTSDAPITLGSSSSATPDPDPETPEPEPTGEQDPDTRTSGSGSIPADSLGMVEVEYEGKPLGDEPVKY